MRSLVIENKPWLLSKLRFNLIAQVFYEATKIDFVGTVVDLEIAVIIFEAVSNSSIDSERFCPIISNRHNELLVLIKPSPLQRHRRIASRLVVVYDWAVMHKVLC